MWHVQWKTRQKPTNERTLQRDQQIVKTKNEALNVENHVFVTRRTRGIQYKLKIWNQELKIEDDTWKARVDFFCFVDMKYQAPFLNFWSLNNTWKPRGVSF